MSGDICKKRMETDFPPPSLPLPVLALPAIVPAPLGSSKRELHTVATASPSLWEADTKAVQSGEPEAQQGVLKLSSNLLHAMPLHLQQGVWMVLVGREMRKINLKAMN